jgi:hypothetical protein
MNREKYLLNLFGKKGGYVVDGHGVLTGKKEKVPADTAIIFLPETGYCMAIQNGQIIQRMFFESREGVQKFLKSGREKESDPHIHLVTNLLSKTFLPGDNYNNMTINVIPNKQYGNMGYIRKLPFLRRATIHRKTVPPTYAETAGPIHAGRQTLSVLLKSYPEFKKGGVFVISACRVGPNNNTLPMNMAGMKKPIRRGTVSHRIATSTKYFPPKKGYRGTTTMPTFTKNNNKPLLKERKKLKRHNPDERRRLVNEVLTSKRYKLGTNYKTPRQLLSAFGVTAETARTHPRWLTRVENLFYKSPSSTRKLRARSLPIK